MDFDEGAKLLTVLIDFKPGSRFAVSGYEGVHPVPVGVGHLHCIDPSKALDVAMSALRHYEKVSFFIAARWMSVPGQAGRSVLALPVL